MSGHVVKHAEAAGGGGVRYSREEPQVRSAAHTRDIRKLPLSAVSYFRLLSPLHLKCVPARFQKRGPPHCIEDA